MDLKIPKVVNIQQAQTQKPRPASQQSSVLKTKKKTTTNSSDPLKNFNTTQLQQHEDAGKIFIGRILGPPSLPELTQQPGEPIFNSVGFYTSLQDQLEEQRQRLLEVYAKCQTSLQNTYQSQSHMKRENEDYFDES